MRDFLLVTGRRASQQEWMRQRRSFSFIFLVLNSFLLHRSQTLNSFEKKKKKTIEDGIVEWMHVGHACRKDFQSWLFFYSNLCPFLVLPPSLPGEHVPPAPYSLIHSKPFSHTSIKNKKNLHRK